VAFNEDFDLELDGEEKFSMIKKAVGTVHGKELEYATFIEEIADKISRKVWGSNINLLLCQSNLAYLLTHHFLLFVLKFLLFLAEWFHRPGIQFIHRLLMRHILPQKLLTLKAINQNNICKYLLLPSFQFTLCK